MSIAHDPVDLGSIERAQARLRGHIAATPPRRSATLSRAAGVPVFLKVENEQPTGSFKLRGATNAVLSLDEGARARGVVTASTGNHGRAVAHAARGAGISATVCLSSLVPANKVAAVRAEGARIEIVGRSQDDAQAEVARLVREEGMSAIPPFDHPAVIAGQGTIGLEIVSELPEVATVLVPLSGGGLAAGVALAVKSLRPRARVIGISMARGAAMHASLAAGRPVAVEEVATLADSLGGGIELDNRYTFALCRELLDETLLLSEAEIAAGIVHAFEAEGVVIEGAAAVGIGALLAGKVRLEGPTVALLTGCNIDPDLHRRVVAGEGPDAAERAVG